ncbi:L-ascorbate oxidase [Phakopsora pachyrhizi]|nr:L-ascorbate oxidase [Phakopsora pachyrhizi]
MKYLRFIQLFLILKAVDLYTLVAKKEEGINSHKAYDASAVLVISEKNIAADCTIRPSTVINGTLPGPLLRFKEGQKIRITVINLLQHENTTIHYHGLSQRGSPFSDGTQKTSQWAIPPRGGRFDYEFFLEKGSAGTYMYHAHNLFQVSTAYGPLIVDEATKPPFNYFEDRMFMIGDYYHSTDQELISKLLGTPFAWIGDPQSVLVNGQALNVCNTTSPHGCENSCAHHITYVKPDKVYRIRVAGITSLAYLYMAIESHTFFEIIEVDSAFVKPLKVNHMQLNSGQRYSFLLKTKSEAEIKKLGKTSFWIRFESKYRTTKVHGQFILQYQSVDKDDHLSKSKTAVVGDLPKKTSNSLLEPSNKEINNKSPPPPLLYFQKLVPIPSESSKDEWSTSDFSPLLEERPARRSEVNRRIIVRGQQIKSADGSIKWYANGQTYHETQPHVPYLVRAYTEGIKPNYEAAKKNNGFDKDLKAYPIKLNEIVDIVYINVASTTGVTEAHPWHIHGKKPFIVAKGTGNFSEEALKKAEEMNKHPIRRDTEVLFPGKGAAFLNQTVPTGTETYWFVMRLKANEAGAMLAHCHTQSHMLMGMAVVFLIGIENLPVLPSDIRAKYL